MKKYKFLFVVCLLGCLLFTVSSNAQSQEINVIFNGKQIEFDQGPIIQDNRVLVPIRKICESFAVDIEWHENIQTATLKKRYDMADVQKIIEIKVNNNIVKINGETRNLDVPAINVNGRILIPVRFVSEAFGLDVKWDSNDSTVIIKNLYDESFDYFRFNRYGGGDLNFFVRPTTKKGIYNINVISMNFVKVDFKFDVMEDDTNIKTFEAIREVLVPCVQLDTSVKLDPSKPIQKNLLTGTWIHYYVGKKDKEIEILNTFLNNDLCQIEEIIRKKISENQKNDLSKAQ